MHFRFELGMKNPGDKEYDPGKSLSAEASKVLGNLTIRGHSHAAKVYQVQRDLTEPIPGGVVSSVKPRDNSVSTKGDRWEIPLDPGFKYVLVSASAAGANTMFTKGDKLDYRPAGLIVDYDQQTQRGKATFFTVREEYDHQRFIDSVTNDKRWGAEVFKEAKRQIKHLQEGTLLGVR